MQDVTRPDALPYAWDACQSIVGMYNRRVSVFCGIYHFSPPFVCLLMLRIIFSQLTLGATTDTCEGRMPQMHMVCTSNKAHKAAFGIQRQALWDALCLCVGEKNLPQSHPLSVKGSFVVFIPSADHMCLSHVASVCVACCLQSKLHSILTSSIFTQVHYC
jgi:hypothetical protein